MLLWPALALLAGGVLLLAAISAMRATEVGHSPALVFFSVVLSATLGPAILVPITYLAFKEEVKTRLPSPTALSTWLQPFALLALPWVILLFFGLGRLQ